MLKNLLISAVLAVSALSMAWAGEEFVPREKAHELVKKGALLLDVRTTDEFKEGHLEGAKNIPVQDLAKRLKEVEPKSRPVVVYCAAGARAAMAAKLLRDAGFKEVHNLGGMSNW